MIDKVGETRHYRAMEEIQDAGQVNSNEDKPTLEQILASQPLNPLRPLEFRVLPLTESHDN